MKPIDSYGIEWTAEAVFDIYNYSIGKAVDCTVNRKTENVVILNKRQAKRLCLLYKVYWIYLDYLSYLSNHDKIRFMNQLKYWLA